MGKHGTVRTLRVTLDAAHLHRAATGEAPDETGVLVGVPARLLDDRRGHPLMLGPDGVVHAGVEATLRRPGLVDQDELDVPRPDLPGEAGQPVEVAAVRDELGDDDVMAGAEMRAR